jgi:hypothetical protein
MAEAEDVTLLTFLIAQLGHPVGGRCFRSNRLADIKQSLHSPSQTDDTQQEFQTAYMLRLTGTSWGTKTMARVHDLLLDTSRPKRG